VMPVEEYLQDGEFRIRETMRFHLLTQVLLDASRCAVHHHPEFQSPFCTTICTQFEDPVILKSR